MGIYFAVYLFFFLFSAWDLFIADRRKAIKISLMALLGITMVIFAGIRWETGTDWENYLYYFKIIDIRPIGGTAMEIGYEMIVRLFKSIISTNYTAFLFFCAIYIILITYFALYKFSPFPLFSLFLLLSYSFAGSGFGVRQDLSIALTLVSLIFIVERSLIKFVVIVLLAALIHNSAIIFLPAYWLYSFKWNTVKVLTVIIFTLFCVLFSERLMTTFGSLISARKVELYLTLGMETDINPYSTLIKGLLGRFLFFVILVGFVDYKNEDRKLFSGLFNLYVFGIVIFSIFSPISLIFGRLARYYDIYQILLLPLAYLYAKRVYKIIIFLVVSAFSLLKFATALNGAEGTFIPYKTIFSK
ncbi:EpsG family protein [Dyadobacter bucti]|uniref:EpsG family protein n=1 Tax=Dyadobacter bucti TaxID=2572203 RepID=UPI003F70EBD9